MAGKTRRAALVISADERERSLAAGVEAGLKDQYHRPKVPLITQQAKAWVLNIACTKPTDHGLAAELWTLSALARYTREHAPGAGHVSLTKAGKATIWRILHAGEIKPHKVEYYLERRDAQFDEKMREVLLVYQEVALANAARAPRARTALRSLPSVWTRNPVFRRSRIPRPICRRYRGSTAPGAGTTSTTSAMGPCPSSRPSTCTTAKSSRKFTRATAAASSSCCSRISMSTTRRMQEKWRAPSSRQYVKSREELKQRIMQGVREMNLAPVVVRWKKFALGLA